MKTSTQKLTIYTAVILLLVILGLVFYVQSRSDDPPRAVSGELELSGQPSLGQDDAPVKIAVFEDFKCPFCRAFDENVLPRIKRNYIDSGQVEAYFINLPFIGPDSTTAALAGECAYRQNEAAFWDYKTYIFRSQGPEREVWATPERLAEIARTYVPALDADALLNCIEEERYAEAVEADLQMADALGVRSTPTVFVNGEPLASNSYEAVQTAIEAALADN